MRFLVFGDPSGDASYAAMAVKKSGASVLFCETAAEICALLRSGRGVELILADVRKDVPELIRTLISARLPVPVAAFGPEDDARAAADAMKAGAREYIPLPPDQDLVDALVGAMNRSCDGNDALFQSDAMRAVFALCAKVAPTEATALITGESGTGKEVVARYLHKHSKRVKKTMVSVNCAAMPETLLETELFGHEKGAFTGADARRIGRFEEAHGSTLFLDEIAEATLLTQAKLLRAVQEKEINRVGGSGAPVKTDVRILAAANKNLQEEVKNKRFREDLYYRLNVIRVHLPPLRERPEDIPLLAGAFAARYARLNGVRAASLSSEAEKKLLSYPWPGNVRELENTIHRAVLLTECDHIVPEDIRFTEEQVHGGGSVLPQAGHGHTPPPGIRPGMSLAEIEKETVLRTMAQCYGNRTKAAEILGVTARTLRNKLKEYYKNDMPENDLTDE